MSKLEGLREEIIRIIQSRTPVSDEDGHLRAWPGEISDDILAIPALARLLALAEQTEQEGFEVVVVDNQASGLSKYGEDTPLMCNDITECPKTGWRKVVR